MTASANKKTNKLTELCMGAVKASCDVMRDLCRTLQQIIGRQGIQH